MTSDATAQGGSGGGPGGGPAGNTAPGGTPGSSRPGSRPRANGSGSPAASGPAPAGASIPLPPQAGEEGAHAPHGKEGAPGATAPGGTAPKDRPQTNPRSAILGDCVALLLQSPGHRHLFLADLEWQLLPPLGLGQFRVWRKDLMPVITASRAFVSPEVDARLAKGLVKLGPQDWKSGEILWLMDILCPYGGMAEAVKELKSQVFQGRPVKTLQPAPDGGMGVVTW